MYIATAFKEVMIVIRLHLSEELNEAISFPPF
jgi:hypothetical protein